MTKKKILNFIKNIKIKIERLTKEKIAGKIIQMKPAAAHVQKKRLLPTGSCLLLLYSTATLRLFLISCAAQHVVLKFSLKQQFSPKEPSWLQRKRKDKINTKEQRCPHMQFGPSFFFKKVPPWSFSLCLLGTRVSCLPLLFSCPPFCASYLTPTSCWTLGTNTKLNCLSIYIYIYIAIPQKILSFYLNVMQNTRTNQNIRK
jgi:hypothetical protein